MFLPEHCNVQLCTYNIAVSPLDMKQRKRVTKLRAGGRSASKTEPKSGNSERGGLSLMASAGKRRARKAAIDKILEQYRPLKKSVTMRVDADVLAWFKKDGRRYQTRINRALRKVMAQEMKGKK